MNTARTASPLLADRRISVDAQTLSDLLGHAASASRLVGHLDDADRGGLVGQLADHVDALTHELSELLGDPCAFADPPGIMPNSPGTAVERSTLARPQGGDR